MNIRNLYSQKIDDANWQLFDVANDEEVATATLTPHGWNGILNPKLCLESINFLEVICDTPEKALEEAVRKNVAMIQDAFINLCDIKFAMRKTCKEPLENVPVDVMSGRRMIQAAV